MAIIKIIVRKMLNNRWLTISLFLGLIITVSLVSSIPTYTSSVLQKLLIGELEDYQIEQKEHPGVFSYSVNFSKDDEINVAETLNKVEKFNEQLIKDAGIETETELTILSTKTLKTKLELQASDNSQPSGRIISFSNIEDHITITDGTFPNKETTNNVMEVLVPEKALLDRDIVIGYPFVINEGKNEFKIKPVGTFTAKDFSDPYWTLSPDTYSNDFIIPEEVFRKELLNNRELLDTAKFTSAFDYSLITGDNLKSVLTLENKVNKEISSMMETIILVDFPAYDILHTYEQRKDQLRTMLWSLNVPVLVMLAIYLYMVSRLIVNRQLNEIAIFTSRGAKRSQIFVIYLIEITILGAVAFTVGPYIGLFFCNMLGSTNGFLEFVQRTPLPIKLTYESFLYGLIAIVISILMVMIPVFSASKQTIVHHKQNTMNTNKYKWYSAILDVFLIGISLYGLFNFNKSQDLASVSATGDITVDPILFFLPAIFIIGVGLFILRLYPLILKAVYKIGERFWSISLYSTLLQVSRSAKQYQFLMMFLIMTIGIGMFSASSARTLNGNLEEQIWYENGAELALDIKWKDNSDIEDPNYQLTKVDEENEDKPKTIVYQEPPFDLITKLHEVEHATKVFKKNPVKVTGNGKSIFSTELMAIEPKEFGQTAWFKSSLLPYHWYQYLNIIAEEPSAILISSSLSTALRIKEGDYVSIEWSESDSAEFVIFGVIDYWPSFNPLKQNENGSDSTLVVANLPYVQNLMGLEPYQVWVKTKPESTRNSLYESIRKQGLPLLNVEDVRSKLVELKNGAFILGLNGSLTLGFIISILITFIGFLIYWILTIKSRTLQYGIYRAMGIPMHKLIGILVWEQLLTSVIACLLGVILGVVTSLLFVPLFKLSFDPQTIVPPFRVIFDASDELKIYIFVSFMLIVGLSILVILLRKIKIHQAVKLGED